MEYNPSQLEYLCIFVIFILAILVVGNMLAMWFLIKTWNVPYDNRDKDAEKDDG